VATPSLPTAGISNSSSVALPLVPSVTVFGKRKLTPFGNPILTPL
jgi:hypothetical protein